MTLMLTHLGEEPSPSKGLEIEIQTKDPNILLEIEKKVKIKALQMQI